MSSAKIRNTLSRQWEILKMLPTRGPGLTKREVCERLRNHGIEVSERTVERDLNELSTLFPLVRNDKGIPYGWHWAKHASLDVPGVSAAESLSLCMVEQTIKPLLPLSVLQVMKPRFEQARNKLNNLHQQSRLTHWQQKVANVQPMLEQLAPDFDDDVFEVLQDALLYEKQVEVTYTPLKSNKKKQYTLNPLGLVQRGVIVYIVATVKPYQDVLLFAVHRIKSAALSDSGVEQPEHFNLKSYIDDGAMQFASGERIQLQLCVEGLLVRVLRESPLSDDQVITAIDDAEETYSLEATVVDSWQLRWWILSQGNAVTVLAPDSLRIEIKQKLSDALSNYK